MRAFASLSLAALALAACAEEPPPAGSGPPATDVAVADAGAGPVAQAAAPAPDVSADAGVAAVAAAAAGPACKVCWDATCPDLKEYGLPACPASDAAAAATGAEAAEKAGPKKGSGRRSGDAGTGGLLGMLHGAGDGAGDGAGAGAGTGGLLGNIYGPRDPASGGLGGGAGTGGLIGDASGLGDRSSSGLRAASDGQSEHDARTRAVVSGEPTILGALDRAAVVQVVQASRRALLFCYERRLRKQPTLAGDVRLRIAVGGDGHVTNVTVVKDELGGSDVAQCLAGRAERWTFPAPTAGIAMVTYSLPVHARGVSAAGPSPGQRGQAGAIGHRNPA